MEQVKKSAGMRRASAWIAVALVVAPAWPVTARAAEETPTVALKIRDHKFIPEEIQIASGQKHLLVVENEDATAEEFESNTLHREKIIPGRSSANIYIGPLKPGRYEFYGEFNETTARGAVVAK